MLTTTEDPLRSEVTSAVSGSILGRSPQRLGLELKHELFEALGVPKPDPPAISLGRIIPTGANQEKWENIPSWVALLTEIRAFLAAANIGRERDARADYQKALRAFLDALHIDAAAMSDVTRDHYILSMVPIFHSLATERLNQAVEQLGEAEDDTPQEEDSDG